MIVPTRLLLTMAALRCVAARAATYGDGGGGGTTELALR
jgi:hypothetical protein